jgi:hypothetical protein
MQLFFPCCGVRTFLALRLRPPFSLMSFGHCSEQDFITVFHFHACACAHDQSIATPPRMCALRFCISPGGAWDLNLLAVARQAEMSELFFAFVSAFVKNTNGTMGSFPSACAFACVVR